MRKLAHIAAAGLLAAVAMASLVGLAQEPTATAGTAKCAPALCLLAVF